MKLKCSLGLESEIMKVTYPPPQKKKKKKYVKLFKLKFQNWNPFPNSYKK